MIVDDEKTLRVVPDTRAARWSGPVTASILTAIMIVLAVHEEISWIMAIGFCVGLWLIGGLITKFGKHEQARGDFLVIDRDARSVSLPRTDESVLLDRIHSVQVINQWINAVDRTAGATVRLGVEGIEKLEQMPLVMLSTDRRSQHKLANKLAAALSVQVVVSEGGTVHP